MYKVDHSFPCEFEVYPSSMKLKLNFLSIVQLYGALNAMYIYLQCRASERQKLANKIRTDLSFYNGQVVFEICFFLSAHRIVNYVPW